MTDRSLFNPWVSRQTGSRTWRTWLLAWTVAVAGVLAGCDDQRIAETEEGVTTETQVLQRWGQPHNVWEGANGERIFEYNRQPQGTSNYMIGIDAQGQVTSLRQVLHRGNFARVQPGMMFEDVRKMLGQPARKTTYPNSGQTVVEWRFREGHAAVAGLFSVTLDNDWRVVSTHIGEDPADMNSPHSKH